MRKCIALVMLVAGTAPSCTKQSPQTEPPTQQKPFNGLESSASFTSISDDTERSKALFGEMSKVLQHPRCVNCHPAGESPLQGNDMLVHQPLVVRGEDGHGAPGLHCDACHGEANFQNVPGVVGWHLAPATMAWEGKSTREICEQLKDPQRNGGLDLEGLIQHIEEDALVGWGWNPPKHLEPAPGNQALLGDLTRAWVASGAHCP